MKIVYNKVPMVGRLPLKYLSAWFNTIRKGHGLYGWTDTQPVSVFNNQSEVLCLVLLICNYLSFTKVDLVTNKSCVSIT